jgi:hypothetical protein
MAPRSRLLSRSWRPRRLIEDQFVGINQSLYSNWNPSRLNASAQAIEDAINTGRFNESSYMLATLTAYNATQSATPVSGGLSSTPSGSSKKQGNTTSLAM